MTDLFFARADMALSLTFHIIFAAVGITMPLMMVIAEVAWLRTKDPQYEKLAKLWAKGSAVFFAIGAVSGTTLAFELGLLFPGLMKKAGAVIGLPFSLEGFAFFTEAIFLGIYLYGWKRVTPRLHVFSGIVVAVSGALSAGFVTAANAWMNHPQGFQLQNGNFVDIDPLKAMLSPFGWHEIPHTLFACYAATGLAVAAIHAFALLRLPGHRFHEAALSIALAVAVPASLAQPFIGHFAGQQVAEYQPLKFAAMEGLFETQSHAPVTIGGITDYSKRTHHYGIEVPGLLSFLATNDFSATIKGLAEFPEEDWPPALVHYCFDIMVGLGSLLFLYSLAAIVLWLRKKSELWSYRNFLRVTLAVGPLGLLAMETGWYVTEVGRQPWTIYGIMRTTEAVTRLPGMVIPLLIFCVIYVVLGVIVGLIMKRFVRSSLSEVI